MWKRVALCAETIAGDPLSATVQVANLVFVNLVSSLDHQAGVHVKALCVLGSDWKLRLMVSTTKVSSICRSNHSLPCVVQSWSGTFVCSVCGVVGARWVGDTST